MTDPGPQPLITPLSHHPRQGSLALLSVHFAVKTVKAGGSPGGLKLEAPSLTWAVSLYLKLKR